MASLPRSIAALATSRSPPELPDRELRAVHGRQTFRARPGEIYRDLGMTRPDWDGFRSRRGSATERKPSPGRPFNQRLMRDFSGYFDHTA